MKCGEHWAIEDPNEEDRSAGNAHECNRDLYHEGQHRCACGEEKETS